MRKFCKLFFFLCLSVAVVSCCEDMESSVSGTWAVSAYDECGRYQTVSDISQDETLYSGYADLPVPVWHFPGLYLELSDGKGIIKVTTRSGFVEELQGVSMTYKVDKYNKNIKFVLTRHFEEYTQNFVYDGYLEENTGRLIIEFFSKEEVNSAVYFSRI